jgi:hypothetical protein
LVARWDVAGVDVGKMAAAAKPAIRPPVERRGAERPWKEGAKAPAGALALPARRSIAAERDEGWKEF